MTKTINLCFYVTVELLQENTANLERSINNIVNLDQLEMLESLSHYAMKCSDETVRRALKIQCVTGEGYKGKPGLQQLKNGFDVKESE